MLLDYKLCVCTMFLFLDQIPAFYVKSWSLFAEISLLLSKLIDFYAGVLIWVYTCEQRPVRLSWGLEVLQTQTTLLKTGGMVGFEWVRLRRCA